LMNMILGGWVVIFGGAIEGKSKMWMNMSSNVEYPAWCCTNNQTNKHTCIHTHVLTNRVTNKDRPSPSFDFMISPASPFIPRGPGAPLSPLVPLYPLPPRGPWEPLSPGMPCDPLDPGGPETIDHFWITFWLSRTITPSRGLVLIYHREKFWIQFSTERHLHARYCIRKCEMVY
jgi:hypothetical protein